MRRRRLVKFLVAPLIALSAMVAAGYDYVRGTAFLLKAANIQGKAQSFADFHTYPVEEANVSVPWRGGTLRGRVYRGEVVRGPATLLVPGVHAGGIDEPRLIQFAKDVASMGRYVIAVELPDLKTYSITPRATD